MGMKRRAKFVRVLSYYLDFLRRVAMEMKSSIYYWIYYSWLETMSFSYKKLDG